jgi:hypothetical protein
VERRHRPGLVAGHGRGKLAIDVEVDVVADADLDLDDAAAGEGELGRVFLADGVAGVAADPQPPRQAKWPGWVRSGPSATTWSSTYSLAVP